MKIPQGYEAFTFTPGVGFHTGDTVKIEGFKQPDGTNPAFIGLPRQQATKPKRRRRV